jgi:hypothetical protein
MSIGMVVVLAILLWSSDITDCLHVFRAFKFGIVGK